jgi:AcrR family transcriptional regulator
VRRRLKPDARRLEIIEAAEYLLKRHGADIRVEDVVGRAKAAKGTFYAYFDSWDDLLDTIRQRAIVQLESAASSLITAGPEADWKNILPALALLLIDFITASGGLHDALFHSDFTRKRPLPPQARLAARIAGILSAGIAAGAYAKLDPDPTGQLISAVIHETADQILAGADRARCIAALDRLLHRLVFIESEADQGRSP